MSHQQLRLGLHPRGYKRGEVQPGVTVENELVPHDLRRGAGQHAAVRQAELRDLAALLTDIDGVDVELGGLIGLVSLRVQRHLRLPG
jgi:hypothetical protein